MVQHDLSFSQALQYYSLLTIGDGLVAQIPSLLLSTAAAVMVTRANSSETMGAQVFSQMFASPRALSVAAAILFIMGIVPGMPHVAFLMLALAAAGIALGLATAASAAEDPAELRIGYQKYGTLVILKERGALEKRLADRGIEVRWTEFPAGPQMLKP